VKLAAPHTLGKTASTDIANRGRRDATSDGWMIANAWHGSDLRAVAMAVRAAVGPPMDT
jgi:hypothetical protein